MSQGPAERSESEKGRNRRGAGGRGKVRKTSSLGAAAKRRSPNCKRKGNLRGKRPDPSHQVSGRPKAGAALMVNGGDAKRACRRVPTQSGVRATAVVRRTGPRGLTRRIAGGNAHDGPAMRPRPSLAAKNGVGDPAASESWAPNAGDRERERGELPLPNLAREPQGSRALLFSRFAPSPAACIRRGRHDRKPPGSQERSGRVRQIVCTKFFFSGDATANVPRRTSRADPPRSAARRNHGDDFPGVASGKTAITSTSITWPGS